jgi:predicted regulator of Ras-like GTPase activity (Roadblock/LC7/MglB family)
MQLKETLEKLVEVEGIEAAVVSGTDGLMIEGVAADGSDLDTLAAVGTYAMQASVRMSEVGDRGPISRVTIEGEGSCIAMQPLRDVGILIVTCGESINLGYVRFLLERYGRRLVGALRLAR